MLRDLLSDLRFRLRALFRRDQVERELADELQLHIKVEADRLVRAGTSPDEAHRQAHLALGGVEQVKEATRDTRGLAWVDSLSQDVRYAARRLRRNPGFTGITILALALGIGANGAVFSILQSALLQPLPYDDPSRLVILSESSQGQLSLDSAGTRALTGPMVMNLHHAAPGQLGEVAAGLVANVAGQPGVAAAAALDLTMGDRTIRLNAASVTPNFFRVLGVRAGIGRVFDDTDEQAAGVAIVLSDATWHTVFGADPTIIGRTVTVTTGIPRLARTFTVVGVLPRGVHFTYPDEVEAWVLMPWNAVAQESPYRPEFTPVARLRPGLSPEQARPFVVSMPLDRTVYPTYHPAESARIGLTPMHEWVVGNTRPTLYLLGGVAVLLLLVTCVTVSNGLLARTAERRQELAVRAALGAARSRVMRQLLVEGTLLVIGGVIAGIGLAILVQPILRELLPNSLPQVGELRVNGNIVAFAAVMTAVTTLLAAFIPAWGGTRRDAAASLSHSASGTTAGRSTVRWRHLLVGAQAALTTLLLIVSTLLLTSLWRLGRVPLGFDPHDVLAVDLQLLDADYLVPGAMTRFQEELLRGVRQIPGIAAAGLTSAIPFRGFDSPGRVGRPGRERDAFVHVRYVDSAFFAAFRVLVMRGRLLNSSDRVGSPEVAVISASYALLAFGSENPIGQTIQLANPTQVVGVVGDLRYAGLDKAPSPAIYVPRLQHERPLSTLIVRLDAPTRRAEAIDGIRHVLHGIDPALPALHVAMVDQVIDATVAGRRFYSVAAGAFAVVALLLTTVGLALVVAQAVAERRRELAVRIALGAEPTAVVRLILDTSARLVSVGGCVGLFGALAATRLLTAFLYDVSPTAPWVYGGAVLLLGTVALIASLIPTRRALRIDPLEALRSE